MMQKLSPALDLVAEEYVLVQAWKKTSQYIRYHNWFADTLELDRATADLPSFIASLSDRLKSGTWQTDALRLVVAPKSQQWSIHHPTQRWRPTLGPAKVRPLGHVSLSDQVAATALLLCLSERVETLQGDPRGDISRRGHRRGVISYGNRLFCDTDPDTGKLVHRWGSAKLYRGYFADYRSFLARPEAVAVELSAVDERVAILHSDLSQFYDRISPRSLREKLRSIALPDDDDRFFGLAEQILDWRWAREDQEDAERYARSAGLASFDRVSLPQGLVAAGFFSNVVMLPFDESLRGAIGNEVAAGVILRDACRYVDDLRLTLTLAPGVTVAEAEARSTEWLGRVLTDQAAGLKLAAEKTKAAAFGGEEQRLVSQSRKMERIQAAISGGFDATGGEDVIQAIEALVQSQAAITAQADPHIPAAFTTVGDVKDDTLGRFAAGRYRTAYRSLRPLLEPTIEPTLSTSTEETPRRSRTSQVELDDDARVFALGLIRTWMENPANVRLLRVGLDLWPSPQVLSPILELMEPYLKGSARSWPRRIVFYCLGEILRAGATETGFVSDSESFPANVNLEGYRSLLASVALRIVNAEVSSAPWYLKQQALLYLAAYDPSFSAAKRSRSPDTYRQMIQFLLGEHAGLDASEYAIRAVVARRSFLDRDQALQLLAPSLTAERLVEVASRDIDLARDLWRATNIDVSSIAGVSEDLGAADWSSTEEFQLLRTLVSKGGAVNQLRNEIGVLSFAHAFLTADATAIPAIATPSNVQVRTREFGKYAEIDAISFRAFPIPRTYRSIYTPPSWVRPEDAWKFQLGFLIRYILTARVDFSTVVAPPSWRENEQIYRPTTSHWFQRQYGFYNGHEAFGDDWLPISQFVQDFLFALLSWPGCRPSNTLNFDSREALTAIVEARLNEARRSVGSATGVLVLQVDAPIPGISKENRPLRGCVVQSVTPEPHEILADPRLQTPVMRRKHRNHLSTALSAVEKMLDLRETHRPQNKRLDWLILPELAVHPADVRTHLIPFARAFKTAILAGVTYEQVVPGQLLVNSAIWIIPTIVPGQGLQVIVRRQGKQHLSPMELPLNDPIPTIQGFRPCQWLIGYEWAPASSEEPLWLTGAICYDATDLCLAADLKSRSDVFAVPSLNRDVGTFDLMAQALHYHMYQMVIVANNGTFGGSNAHVPKGEAFQRQIFHTHGQPQASISFFEIDDIAEMKSRRQLGIGDGPWKYPPAG